jgi:hypothetical protein
VAERQRHGAGPADLDALGGRLAARADDLGRPDEEARSTPAVVLHRPQPEQQRVVLVLRPRPVQRVHRRATSTVAPEATSDRTPAGASKS